MLRISSWPRLSSARSKSSSSSFSPSYSARCAKPSKYSSVPSRFCRNVIGLPWAVAEIELSAFCLKVILSARMVIVPCVMTTLPERLPTLVW